MPPLPAGRKYSTSPYLLLALLALGAKARAAGQSPAPAAMVRAPESQPLAEGRPLLTLQPGAAKPGDPVLVSVRGMAELPSGTLAGRPLHFFPWGEGFLAVTGLPVEMAPGTAAKPSM